MIMLSKSAIQYAFMICSEKENYKVGVYCADKEYRELVEGWIDTLQEPYSYCIVENRSVQRNMRYVSFKNGSVIKVIHAGDSSRGNRCHLCICSPLLSPEAVQMVKVHELGGKRYQETEDKAQIAHRISDKEKSKNE